MSDKKDINIRHSFRLFTVIPIVVLVAMLGVFTLFIVLYTQLHNSVFLFLLIGLLVVLGLGYLILCIFMLRWFYRVFYFGLFEVTSKNLQTIVEGKADLSEYPDVNIKEIKELNENTDQVRTVLENAYLVTHTPNFDNLNLEYIDKKRNLITFDSLKNNLSNLIFLSQSFRNVIIEVYYDFPDGELTPSNESYLLNVFYNAFSDFEQSLFAFRDDHRSLLIYLPVIDSFSRIQEILNLKSKDVSVSHRSVQGLANIPARFAIVAYPYSNEEMILGDLKYAVSQGKPFNLYLPTRYKNNIDAKLLMNTSMNLNYSSKIIGALSELDYSAKNNERNHVLLREVFDAITNFMDIDDGGIIVYNSLADQYQTYATNSRGFMFNGAIDKSFVEKLGAAVDDDDVYSFAFC